MSSSKDEKPTDAAADGTDAAKKKKKLVLIGAAAAVVLLGGGGGTPRDHLARRVELDEHGVALVPRRRSAEVDRAIGIDRDRRRRLRADLADDGRECFVAARIEPRDDHVAVARYAVEGAVDRARHDDSAIGRHGDRRPRRRAGRPAPLSDGKTVVLPRTGIAVDDGGGAALAMVGGGASLQSLVGGLNTLGVSPRDLITILQAVKSAGALQAEIEVE